MKQRILVTGSSGIIGGHVVRFLTAKSDETEIIKFSGDLTDFQNTRASVLTAGRVDSVIHLAAKVEVESSKMFPAQCYGVNVGGTINILSAIAELRQTPNFFLCSSAHIYAPQNHALTEETVPEPVSFYGRTKWMSEKAAKDICSALGIPLCIGRVFSIHDPKQGGSFLRPSILRRLDTHDFNLPFDLYGADSIRDFLSAEKAAKIIVSLVLNKYTGTINIGSGKPTLIREFVQQLAAKKLDFNPMGLPDCLLADTSRLDAFMEANGESTE